jgi:hypothetical protein
MAEWGTVENRAPAISGLSSSPVDIAEPAVDRRGVSALTRGQN